MSGNVLSVPTELLRTELKTKVIFMESMKLQVPIREAAVLFFQKIGEARMPVPNYGRSCSSWSDLFTDSVEDGLVVVNGTVGLSQLGQSHLESLRKALDEVP